MNPHASKGLAVLVGAGPGDVSLITQAGLDWLSRADVVIYDRLAGGCLLLAAPPKAELIYVGKQPGCGGAKQEQINELLVAKCLQGLLVVRLKGGDPLVFGRGGEEIDALVQAGVPFRIVPGVTAGVAAGAYAGIPLTDRRAASTVAFVSGQEDPARRHGRTDWQALARMDTIVVYMGVANLPQIARLLMDAGKSADTPAAVVANASTGRQRTAVGTLATIAAAASAEGIEPPAVAIIGNTVSMRQRMAWYEKLPLYGQTVLVTRARQQASELSARLARLGAQVIEAPTILIEPPQDMAAVDAALRRLGEFQWLILTSANGVDALFGRLEQLALDARALCGVRVAAVGAATAAALQQRSIRPDLVPESFTTAELGGALLSRGMVGKRLLLARADIASPGLTQLLAQGGAVVEEIALYRTRCPDALPQAALEALRGRAVHWITFTSSSTVENFARLVAEEGLDLSQVKTAAIGPVTAAALKARGFVPAVVAQPHTIEALADAIASYQEPRGT